MASLLTGNSFDPNTDIPDLSGKVYLVTGGSAGIGFGITAHLLQHNPAKILLLSMKEEHAQETLEALQKYGDASKVEWVQCNLEDLHWVDRVANEIREKETRLDGIILNAGLGVGAYNLTKDNVDSHFQVNYLSQFHLALTLLPLLLKTPNSRLCVQSSSLHSSAPSSVKFASEDEINTDIGPAYLYNRSKLAGILFVRALVRRMEARELGFQSAHQVWANATHPGAVATDQQKQAEDAYGVVGKVGVAVTRPLMKEPVDQGCRPILFAATSEDVVKGNIQGQYIVPDRKPTSPSSQAQDDSLGEALWSLSVQMLKKRLGDLPYA